MMYLLDTDHISLSQRNQAYVNANIQKIEPSQIAINAIGTAMLHGINHITLSVRDIEQSFDFYTSVLGMRPLAKWPRGAYLLAGNLWVALVVDPAAQCEALPEYSHIAFSVSTEDFESLSATIRASEAHIWQENWTEGDSLYFVDPNGHKLEIHSSDLATRMQSARAQPWEGLEFLE